MKPLGVARISLGASSTKDDVDKFIDFLKRYFLISEEVVSLSFSSSLPSPSPGQRTLRTRPEVYLHSLTRCTFISFKSIGCVEC